MITHDEETVMEALTSLEATRDTPIPTKTLDVYLELKRVVLSRHSTKVLQSLLRQGLIELDFDTPVLMIWRT